MQPILLLDTNYLCHRAFHAMQGMSYGDAGTAVLYGVFRDIVAFQDTFATSRCAFAFDAGCGRRHGILPTYKSSRLAAREKESPEEVEARKSFREQVHLLQVRYLPAIGFRNVYHAPGLEADDVIASIAKNTVDDEVVIVGSDHDLWQCIRENVWCWNPNTKQPYTQEMFRAEWGLEPRRWATVKALAGCGTDDVPGVHGIGEKTAAKWLRGELKPESVAYKKLLGSAELRRRNLQLVRLPFPGTPVFELVPDEVTEDKWNSVMEGLGMRSLMGCPLRGVATKSKGRKRERNGIEGFCL